MRPDRARLLIRADRAPGVKGSLAAAHYCGGPWPSDAPDTPDAPHGRRGSEPDADRAGRPRRPGVPGRRRRPARRARVRRADRVQPAGRGRRAGADPAGQGGAGAAGGRRVPPLRAARAHRLRRAGRRRPRQAMAAVRRRRRRLPRPHPARRLAGGAGQGVRRRRHRQRLLPRGRRLPRRGHPRRWCSTVLQDIGQAEFAVRAVREAIERGPAVAGRLALWGRRLVGEALSQAQRVAVERDALASLLVGGATGRAPTSPRSAGCSPGSPTSTPGGWPAGPVRLSARRHADVGRAGDARRPRPGWDGPSRSGVVVSRSADLLRCR